MVSLINLPAYQASPLLDLSPIAQGLAMRQRQMDQEAQRAMQERKFAEDQRQFGLQNDRANQQMAIQQAQEGRAASMSPIQQRQATAEAAMAERRLQMPMDDGSKVHEVNGQLVRVPRQGQGEVVYGSDPKALRRQEALAMGMKPGSPEALFYEANGKVPAKFYDQKAQDERRAESAPKITEGLRNLAKAPETYGASFESAVGPWQGTDPDSLASAPFVNTARAIGEISNKLGGGKFSPTEVRSNIKGSTEALAAAIKPLIRAPGEGVWTDADQSRLVAVVGDLATASTADEYYRRLNDVRDRIKANFGLDINFDANPKNNARLPPPGGQPAPAQASGASQPLVRVSTPEEAMRLPLGTQFMTPDGRVKVR